MNRAVLWVRVSSEEQSHGYSPDEQERLLKEVAEKHKILIARTFKVAESAKVSETRKNFHEMIKFVRSPENGITHLLARTVSRLGRNGKDVLGTIDDLIQDHGLTVFVFEINKFINRESPPVDRFLFRQLAIIAQLDNDQRSVATKDGMMGKVLRGEMPGHAPEGYQNVPNPDGVGKPIVVLEDESKVALVRQAFELYAEGGWSLSTLTEEMNRRGFRTKPTSPAG